MVSSGSGKSLNIKVVEDPLQNIRLSLNIRALKLMLSLERGLSYKGILKG